MRQPAAVASRAILALALLVCLGGCDDNGSPTSPDPTQAVLAIENLRLRATAPQPAIDDIELDLTFTLRETAGLAATISTVTVTFTDRSGAPTAIAVDPADVFGTTQINARGSLEATGITTTGQLDLGAVAVRIAFVDEGGNQGTAEESMELSLDVEGEWTGELPIRTPVGDWTSATLTLEQNGTEITGELVSSDGFRFPITGSFGDNGFDLLVGGLPGSSTCAGIGLTIAGIEFFDGRIDRISGRAFGRCLGTIAGTFVLERSS
jgi:hypothetical protein